MDHEIELLGRLGNAPELRHTTTGTPVANFSVATDYYRSDSDGTKVKDTIWWKVTAWDKMGQNAAQYLVKGQRVLVKGELKVDARTGLPGLWTDQNGQPRVNLEVTANKIIYLSKPAQPQPQAANPPRQRQTSDTRVPYSHHRGKGVPRQPAQSRRSQPQQYSRRQSGPQQQGRIQDITPQDNFGPDEIPF